MVRIKVKAVPPDAEHDGYHVHLPSYMMIAGTEEYKAGKLVSVEVEVPDDECTDGKPDKAKIRQKYKGQPLWDRPDVGDDVL